MMDHNELDLIYILDTPRWDENWVKVMELAEPVVFVASAASKFAGKEKMVLDAKKIILDKFCLKIQK